MKIPLILALGFVLAGVPIWPDPTGNVTITVGSRPKQTFEGLGTSSWAAGDYMQLTPERRAKLNTLVWRDARFNTLRLWVHLKDYAPSPGQRQFSQAFTDNDAALLRDALAAGVKHIVLGPCSPPDYLLDHPLSVDQNGKPGPGVPHIAQDKAAEHAAIIADFIRDLRDKAHLTLDATGIQNEPNDVNDCQFTPDEMVQSVKLLRAALDTRGLKPVKIIAPETVGAGGTWHWKDGHVVLVDNNTPKTEGDALSFAMIDELRFDDDAWAALGGIATHSYDGGANERMASAIAGTDKEYWMTEFCVGGPEKPGDFFRGSVEAATFLCDMNHGVNYWMHFLGYVSADPNDNGTRLMAYHNGNVPDDKWLDVFEPYNYLAQLGQIFDPGAVFRSSTSSLDGNLTWSRDTLPTVAAAAAKNPDGTWSVGLLNYTNDHFPQDNWFTTSLKGKPAQVLQVTVSIPELAQSGDLTFDIHRLSPDSKPHSPETATLHNGTVILTVNPFELVTMRTKK